MIKEKNKVPKTSCFVYLGRSGGGSIFCRNVISDLLLAGNSVFLIISSGNQELEKYHELQRVFGHKLNLRIVNVLKQKQIAGLFETEIDEFIFLMHSEKDYFLLRKLRKTSAKVILVVHDARRHPGDFLPFNFSLRYRIKTSDSLIALGKHVFNTLSELGFDPILYPLGGKVGMYKNFVNRNEILVIGRLKKYQGIKNLRPISLNTQGLGIKWRIVGAGRIRKRYLPAQSLLENSWQTEDFMIQAILGCHIVLLPYVECSQSGIAALALELGKPLVVTPVGDLPNQVIHLKTGVIAKTTDPIDIARAIDLALSIDWNLVWPSGNSNSVRLDILDAMRAFDAK
jgi:glycosyltransferase involved in cell wall biosynthesis